MFQPKRLSTGVRYKSASELNCLIQFARPNGGVQADGTLNAPTLLWTTHANIAIWRAKETAVGQQRNSQSSFKITIRFNRSDATKVPTSDMIILYHGQTYNIETVSDVDGQQVQLEIWAWIENDGIQA